MILQLGGLALGALVLCLAAIAGIMRIESDSGLAIRGYSQSRDVAEIGFHVAHAQLSLRVPALGHDVALREIEVGMLKLQSRHNWLDETRAISATTEIDLTRAAVAVRGRDSVGATTLLSQCTGDLAELLTQIRTTVAAKEASVARARTIAIELVIGAGILVIVVGSVLAIRLEAKHRELTRAERLAGIGLLAAGVAHEINNPLGIIAGYGERALRKLRRGSRSELNGDDSAALEKSIRIMCDEAFRCKGITDGLLKLARPSTSGQLRRNTSIASIAKDVVDTLAGLPINHRAKVRLIYSQNDSLIACVCEDEIKQVLLNLLLNALGAAREDGLIDVMISREISKIRMTVRDDGAGMTRETLERVFEPFFTESGGAIPDRRGTGLGLSITHAIVTDHGGSIRADSDGPGRGSAFVVELPAAKAEAIHASV